MNKIYHQLTVFILILLCQFSVKGQDCQIMGGTTNLVSSSGSICTFTTILNFSASNSNSANTITITSNAGMTTINSVTNPANITDSSSPFSFNSSFVGNYTITYTVPCSQSTTNFTFTYDGPGNGDCTILTSNISLTPLSVNFVNFEVFDLGKMTKLSFETESETNNDYFTIERSADGRNFEAIGEIKGAGNSNQELSYEFVDENPLAGINYYRIKQTDFDGAYSYTEIRSVRHQTKNVIVSPSRTDGKLNVTSEMDNYDVVIYNTGGQEVQRHMALSGDQSLSIEALQAGVYFVKVMDQTIRIVKF